MGLIPRASKLLERWRLYARVPAEVSAMPAPVPSPPRLPLRAACALLAFQVQDAVERFGAAASAANDPSIAQETLAALRRQVRQISDKDWSAMSELMGCAQTILDGREVQEEEPAEGHAVLDILIDTFSPGE